jgi:hypothetical protein
VRRAHAARGLVAERGQRLDAVLVRDAADLAGEAELGQAGDLALALELRRDARRAACG